MRKQKTSANKTVFFFDNVGEIQQFTEDYYAKTPVGSNADRFIGRFRGDSYVRNYSDYDMEDWFGTTDKSWAGKPIERYYKLQEAEREIEQFRRKNIKADVIDIDQVKRIEFTEKEVGVFSFDLASLGLIRVFEYYSPITKSIVSPNLVVGEEVNGEVKFFFIGQPYIPRHEVKYDVKKGGYFSPILNRIVDKSDLEIEEQGSGEEAAFLYFYPEQAEIPKHEVEQKQMVDESGEAVFTTTWKKCFIDIPKKKGNLPRIDIIIPISYNAYIKSGQIFWNSIAVAAICEKLSKSNVNYRVIAAYTFETIRGNKTGYGFVNIKNENQTFDLNQLGITISDTRFYRYDIFKFIYAMQAEAGWEQYFDSSIGRAVSDTDDIKEQYLKFLAEQDSQSDRDAAKNPNSKIVFDIALTQSDVQNRYDSVIGKISKQVI